MQGTQGKTRLALIGYSDDIDPELLYPGIEEEEEEEELDPDDEPGDEDDEGDRGNDIDPDLPPEEDDDAERDDDDEPEPEPAVDAKKPAMVPHARFNEVNEEAKTHRKRVLELEEELARARGTAPQPELAKDPAPAQAFDFDAAEDRYTDLLLEGDTAAAKKVRAEIRAEEKAMYIADAQTSAKEALAQDSAARAEAKTRDAVTQVLESTISKYPFLDNKSADADADAIEDVIARRDLYMNQGMGMAEALTKAVTGLAARFGWDGEPEPAKKPGINRGQLDRNIERSKQIPERLPGVGGRNTTINYEKLSDDEFSSLSARDKAVARGDVVKGA